jgi:dimethylargininase
MAWLGGSRLVVLDELASRVDLGDGRYELVRVDAAETYAANCVGINDQVLFAAGHPRLEKRLRGLGYDLVVLDMSEFEKMDGGLSCLSLRY